MAKQQVEKTKDKPPEEGKGAPTQPGRVPDLKPGKHSDGHPLDEVQYLECKLILKPDHFTSAKVFQEYGELIGAHEKAIERVKEFFIAPQENGHDWLSLGTTKTGLVYRLKGNPL